jgi:hypothetical protein
MLALSALAVAKPPIILELPLGCRPGVVGPPETSMLALRTLRGRLSRLPPHSDDGASARTDASVSSDRRRRRLLDEASVRIEALSVKRLLAVAVVYVVGCPGVEDVGARWDGIADAGVVGKGWWYWIDGLLPWWLVALAIGPPAAPGAKDWIVVRVVVSDRTEGDGEEKVLPPLRESGSPPVVLVSASDVTPEGAANDLAPSWSVQNVEATERAPIVVGEASLASASASAASVGVRSGRGGFESMRNE